jgi:hypothetical protein
MDTCLTAALRPTEQAYVMACSLAEAVGSAAVDNRLLEPLARVPVGNLAAFRQEHGLILFAHSYLEAVDGDEANARRGYPLSAEQRAQYAEFDSPRRPVYGLYDPFLNALIFSASRTQINFEHLVLHEFGHAMSHAAWQPFAHRRADLLFELPRQIQALVDRYSAGSDPAAVSERVLEALAEAYAWAVVGRIAELPSALRLVAHEMLCVDVLRRAS